MLNSPLSARSFRYAACVVTALSFVTTASARPVPHHHIARHSPPPAEHSQSPAHHRQLEQHEPGLRHHKGSRSPVKLAGSKGAPPIAGTTPAAPVGVAAPAGAGPAPSAALLSRPTLFAPTSIWNQPLSDTARIDPASAAMVSGLNAEVAREEASRIGPWITAGANIYVVGPDQPTVLVQLDDPTAWWRVSLQAAFTSVPIPATAQPGTDADAELSVWQPSTDKLWEFFHTRHLSDGWHAAWGGAMQNVSQSPGYFNTNSWPGALPVWGATASSLPHAAGVITLADIQQGQINHALAVNLPYPCKGVYSWPAQRTDGTGTASNCIPEGAHLRIKPTVDIAALHLPALVQMMAEAVQKYGMIVRDQTQWAIGFWIENPAPTGADPFYNSNGSPTATGPFSGLWPNQLMSYFPWSEVEVLNMAPGKAGVQ